MVLKVIKNYTTKREWNNVNYLLIVIYDPRILNVTFWMSVANKVDLLVFIEFVKFSTFIWFSDGEQYVLQM
jgi:hypothetical protein